MSYPDYETYRQLYARYYQRGVDSLIEKLQPLQGCNFLDICCGDGRASLVALEQGVDHVVLVDQEERMLPKEFEGREYLFKLLVENETVIDALENLDREIFYYETPRFNRVVCQQAINYWFSKETIENLAKCVAPNGIFVFNTFNQKPAEKPRILEYELNGYQFVETSWLVDDKVHHIQVRQGMEPHCTSFRWIEPQEFYETLEPLFYIVEDRKEKTSIYKCTRR